MSDIIIDNWKWGKLVNKTFIPLIDNTDRYLILYGGRGSSKSNAIAKKLIYRCLTEPYFRYILIRNQYNTIKDSSYQTIKDIIIELGLSQLFVFKLQPLEIHCLNGNMFLARGCDDTSTLKSVKDPTGVWYEEDIPTESDFITITSSIRTQKAKYLQEVFTINPEVEGNYQENWFWKVFFKDKPVNKGFSDIRKFKVDSDTEVNLTYTVHHSTHLDNKWLPNEFRAMLMDLKRTNPYYYTVYCLGNWGNKQLGGLFYKKFDIGKNTKVNEYRPDLPLHVSFDFNVNPYMSCTIWQLQENTAYNIDEIACSSPNNDTRSVCREIMYRYRNHRTGMFIYGDPSGRQEDTRSEQGFNDYTIIENELAQFRPELRIANAHPPVHMRGQFINSIFDYNFNGLYIYINEKSVYLKNDLLFGKEAADGTKHKEKVKGDNGTSYEKYHHHSDSFDYFICEAWNEHFETYQNGDMSNYKRITGHSVKNDKLRL